MIESCSLHRATRLALAIAAILGTHGEPLLAADLSWDAPGSDNWFDAPNWSPAGPPTASDNAIIDNGGTAQVASPGAIADGLTAGATNGNSGFLEILSGGTLDSTQGLIGRDAGATGTVSVNGAGSTWDIASLLRVGLQGDGTLNITDGGQVIVTGLGNTGIGDRPGSIGAVTVNGTDSLLISGNGLSIGNFGSGTLRIESGGRVDSLSGGIGFLGSGVVTVAGTGSQWNNAGNVRVGFVGDAALTIADGGQVNNVDSTMGVGANSTATVLVTGDGSQWNSSGDLIIGNQGDATLTIADGGQVDSIASVIGSGVDGSGTVSVTGAGSLWRTTDFITVGASGDGSLTIEDAGQVESLGAVIGSSASGTGTAIVTGVGSAWNNNGGAFLVGFGGDGTLTISEGGQVNVGAFSVIGNSLGSTGSVTVSGPGSLWRTGSFSDLLVAAGGNGGLTIENGGRVDSRGGAIGVNSGVSGTVSVSGAGSQWNNNQNVFVGAGGDGELTVTDGGQVNNSFGVIGNSPSATGTVSVTGAGSQWNNANDLFVGFDGDATLTITDGGRVDNVIGAIGLFAGSTGTVSVSGAGSRWDNSDLLAVGFEGDATLKIEDGGQVDSLSSLIGNRVGGSGTVTVTGASAGMSSTGNLAIGIEGDGELTISNGGQVEAGAVRLADQADSSGTLNIGAGGAPGMLDTAEIIGGTGSTTLNFDHTDSDYFFTRDGTVKGDPVVISGSTVVNHLGGGTTILTGDHTYLGDTTIDNGTLLVNGAIDSASIINAGGTLGGDGTLAAVGFGGAGGIIAPGNSIGTLTVDSIDFAGGGVFEAEIDAAGNADLLNVSGMANLTGGSLSILPMHGDYGLETTYTILQAATVEGIFDDVSIAMPEFAFLDPSLVYSPGQVDLTLARNDVSFEAVAGTWNQQAVGSSIDQLYNDDPEAIQGLVENLFPLSAEGVNAAYDALSGVQHTHTQAIVGNLDRLFQSLLFERLASSGGMGTSHDLSLALSGERWARQLGFGLRSMSLDQQRSVERGLWLRSFGGVGDIDNTANASGADYTSGGVAFGVDAQLKSGVIVGVAAGYAHTDVDTFGGSQDIDSYQLAGYAGWARNDSYLNGSLGAGLHRSDANRRVVVGGFAGYAEADYDTLGVTAALEAGHHLDMNNAVRLTPFVGMAYTHLDRSDFTESGAGSANLAVEEESQESLRSRVGLRFGKTFVTSGGARITPMIETAYVREHLDNQSFISAGFANASDATFRIAGPDLDRNRIQLGAGVDVRFSERSSLSIGYQAEFADSDDQHSLAATFRMRW